MTPVFFDYRQRKVYQPLNHINRMEPIGDPFGGPAYGEKNGPAVALLGAGMSISAGLGIAATGWTLTAGLMVAGGVMSGLGALTGNKTLSKLGMVAGLAGGVGQFFSKAGGFEGMSSAWNAGDTVGESLSNVSDQFTGAQNFLPASDAAATTIGQTGGAVSAVADPANTLLTQPSAAQGLLSSNTAGVSQLGTPGMSPGTGYLSNPTVPGFEASGTTSAMGVDFGAAPPPLSPSATAIGQSAASQSPSDGLLGLWKNSGDLAKFGMVQAGAGAVQGMATADAADKRLKAEQDMYDQSLTLKKQQMATDAKLTDAQTKAIEKKNAGIQVPKVTGFGDANPNETPFGIDPVTKKPRTFAQYQTTMTQAFRNLFQPQQQMA